VPAIIPHGEPIVVDAAVAAEAAQLVVAEGIINIPFLGIGCCFLAIIVGAVIGFIRPLI